MLTALALGALPIAPATPASAATVSVGTQSGNPNISRLEFQADPGESNLVTISIDPYTGPVYGMPWTEPTYRVQIFDKGAAIKAGAGCTSPEVVGGLAGCSMPAPRGPQYESCGFKCSQAIPGTAWEGRIVVRLGEGDNSLDATGLPIESNGESIRLDVSSGDGDDSIATAAGQDRIDPGAGSDEVLAGRADDYLETTSVPDGLDSYDLGEGGEDQVSYRRRSDPVYLSGDMVGAADESDRLVGVEMVAGGSGADVLTGGPVFRLVGNAGDDKITGTEGRDLIAGGPGNDVLLGGGDFDSITGDLGDDVLDGGEGNDDLKDHLDWWSNPGEGSDGADTAYGRGGEDWIDLGAGPDRSSGGDGNDRVYGGLGNDTLDGGPGKDAVVGEAGRDAMHGGPGIDHVLSSRTPQGPIYNKFPRPIDSLHDTVDCGPDRDYASVNPWDSVTACERVTLVRAVELGKARIDPDTDRVSLPVMVTAPGRLTIFGRKIKIVSRLAGRSSYSKNGRPQAYPLPILLKVEASPRVRPQKVRVHVRFLSRGGVARTEAATLRLPPSRR